MEEKKQMKLSLKNAIIIVSISILLICIIGVGVYIKITKNGINIANQLNHTAEVNVTEENTNQDDYEELDIQGMKYYHRLTNNVWKGEHIKERFVVKRNISKQQVVSYDNYKKYIDEINEYASKKIKKYYTDSSFNYIILCNVFNGLGYDMELIDCKEDDNSIIIYGNEESSRTEEMGTGYLIAIPTKMEVGTPVEYRECYSTSEINNVKNHSNDSDIDIMPLWDKPIIYLYPTKDIKVSVRLLNDKNITCSYPKYDNGWNVLAKTNGNLVDLSTNRNLYSLYYESKSDVEFKIEKEGFIVKGEDTIKFLEEKLDILGLTERETEEFIIYWLPKLESNKYNYIRFATKKEINENMPLEINPKPDVEIRILMLFKGLNIPLDVQEQQLVTPSRKGFVAVEWGGTEIK